MMLPRIVNTSGQEVARLNPSSLALDLNFSPLSTAVMTLPEGEPETPVGTLIEIPTPRGSAGVFRVQQAEHTYQGDMRLHLEHGLVTLSDGLIPGTMEEPQQSTARAILGQILSHQSMWRLGTVEVPDSVVLSWSYDYSNLLESLLSVLDELPGYYASCDQSTVPWTLNVLAVDETVQNECRLTRNIESLTVETDRSELCTRLHVVGLPAPLDADTIGQYGVIERSMTGDEGLSAEELNKAGHKYLEEHKHPALTVSINAVDLSEATGDSMDSFLLGVLCRVCLPDYGQTINQRIVTLSWPDMVADESYVRLTLANKAQTTSDALAGLIIDTTIMRKRFTQELSRQKDILIAAEDSITLMANDIDLIAKDVEVNAENIRLYGEHFELMENRLSTVEIDLNAAEATILLKANQTDVDDLQTRVSSAEIAIDGANAAISLKASQTTVDALGERVSAAEIAIDGANAAIELKVSRNDVVAAINLSPEAVKISAAKIELDGQAIVNVLDGSYINVYSIDASEADFDLLNATTIIASSSVQIGDSLAATEDWVQNRGFATTSWVTGTALTPYATQAWVMANFVRKE